MLGRKGKMRGRVGIILVSLFGVLLTDCSCFTLSRRSFRPPTTRLEATNVRLNDKEIDKSGRLLLKALDDPAVTPITPLFIEGMASIPRLVASSRNNNTDTVTCALLSASPDNNNAEDVPLLPVPNCNSLDRLSTRPSRLQLLLWNGAIVNRDNGMFDNLPYPEWTAFGPRDAAGQAVAPTYHWGKRQFYDRFMGKDWYKYSRNAIDETTSTEPLIIGEDSTKETRDAILRYRINEIQLRDVQMRIAECDSEIAILTRTGDDTTPKLEQWNAKRLSFVDQEAQLKVQLDRLKQTEDDRDPSKRLEDTLNSNRKMDSVDATSDEVSFDNPFTMFQSLVKEMLKAEIVAIFLEDISWSSSLVLGGGIVLQRQIVKDTISLAGEQVQVTNEKETFGSDTVAPGELFVVDCYADEAVQLSAACDIALWCEKSLFQEGNLKFCLSAETAYRSLGCWKPSDDSTVLSVQGRPLEYNGTVAKVQLNFDLLSRWEQAVGGETPKQVFPIDNPVESLAEYDELSADDKVSLLLTLGDTDIKIPRPRTIRSTPQRLDELLLPRVDEVVRTQWRFRELERSGGDMDSITKSQRFVAIENAQIARDSGEDDIAEWWENEAELLSSLKADLTQDEGSYSRFLDKDEWYERDRQQAAERARKQFGDLGLD